MLSPVPWPSWPGQWLGLGRRRRSSCQPSSIIYWTTLKQMWQIIVSAIVKNILDHSETYVTGHFVIHPQKYTGPVLNRFTGYRISHPQNYTGPLWNRFTGNGVSHHKNTQVHCEEDVRYHFLSQIKKYTGPLWNTGDRSLCQPSWKLYSTTLKQM